MADLAVLDGSLSAALPRDVTAATGMDAMVHAIEAFTSVRLKNPVSDALALGALKLLHTHFETVTAASLPSSSSSYESMLAAREGMLVGACLAGEAFANAPVGGVHALAYPLGGTLKLPHGLTNCLVLPSVLSYNAVEPRAEEWYGQIAAHLGLTPTSEALINELKRLGEHAGIPTTLAAVGHGDADIEDLARQAMQIERLLQNNPRTMTYEAALACYATLV